MRFVRHASLFALMVIVFGLLSACQSDVPTGPTSDLPASPSPTGTLDACLLTKPEPAVVATETPITLNGSCSTGGSEIVGYMWDLGDGRQKTGVVIHPRYADPGNYDVTLTVEDSTGGRDSATTEIVVYPEAKACFDWNRIGMDEQTIRVPPYCAAGPVSLALESWLSAIPRDQGGTV